MLLAIGNAGGNILRAIRRETKSAALKEAQYVFADCNEDDLSRDETESCPAILLDFCNGSFPTDIFTGVEKLVIVSGLGGKTATKFTESAAFAAKEAGVDDVNVVVTIPFIFEGDNRVRLATSAAQRLAEIGGVNVSVINNEDLTAKYPDLNFFNCFKLADKEILQIIEKL